MWHDITMENRMTMLWISIIVYKTNHAWISIPFSEQFGFENQRQQVISLRYLSRFRMLNQAGKRGAGEPRTTRQAGVQSSHSKKRRCCELQTIKKINFVSFDTKSRDILSILRPYTSIWHQNAFRLLYSIWAKRLCKDTVYQSNYRLVRVSDLTPSKQNRVIKAIYYMYEWNATCK